jgi:hypothetical protein
VDTPEKKVTGRRNWCIHQILNQRNQTFSKHPISSSVFYFLSTFFCLSTNPLFHFSNSAISKQNGCFFTLYLSPQHLYLLAMNHSSDISNTTTNEDDATTLYPESHTTLDSTLVAHSKRKVKKRNIMQDFKCRLEDRPMAIIDRS